MEDIRITAPDGMMLTAVVVEIKSTWLARFLWRWLKYTNVKVTWAEIPDEEKFSTSVTLRSK